MLVGRGSMQRQGRALQSCLQMALKKREGILWKAQLSMAQNILGHHPSWGLQAEEEVPQTLGAGVGAAADVPDQASTTGQMQAAPLQSQLSSQTSAAGPVGSSQASHSHTSAAQVPKAAAITTSKSKESDLTSLAQRAHPTISHALCPPSHICCSSCISFINSAPFAH